MLRKSAVSLQFGGGVDTKADRKQVAPTKLLDLQNAVFTKGTTLAKRNGYAALSQRVDGRADYSNAVGLAARGDELLVFDGARAYSYRESSDTWADTGEVASVVASATPIARTGTVQVIPDVAIRNGIQVAAWEDSRGGVWCSVLEEATGRILLAQTQLDAAGQHPRCVYVDEVIHVLWTRGAAGIFIATVNTAEPGAAPTPALLTNDLSPAHPLFDAESCGPWFVDGQEPAVIAWAHVGGGFRVGYLHASGVLGSAVTGLPSVATYTLPLAGPIAVTPARYSGTQISVVWTTATAVRLLQVSAADPASSGPARTLGGTIANPKRIAACWGRLVDGEPALWWALQVSPSRTDLAQVVSGKALQESTTYDAATTTLRGHTLLTRAFYDGPELRPRATDEVPPTGDVYAFVASGARFYSYTACIRLSADAGIAGGATTCVARLMPGEAPPTHFRRIAPGAAGFEEVRHVSSVVERDRAALDTGSRRHAAPLTYRIQLDGEDGDQFGEAGIRYVTLDFDADASYQTAELGRGLYLAGAAPQHYDGDRWAEAGYHAAPDWGHAATGAPYVAASAFVVGAGGNVDEGGHLYRIWYEDVDAQGELHPGPVSVSVFVTTTSVNKTVTIAVPTYRLTNKRSVRICVARTIAGQTVDGDPEAITFYRVTDTDPAASTGSNRFLLNDPTVDTVTFVDVLSDADLVTREPLYTNGGILSNDPAPWSGGVIASGKGRLFWTDPSDPYMVRFSQERREETALEAPAGLWLTVPPDAGPVVGLAVLDETVFVFARDGLWYFTGPGPLANPSANPQAFAFTPVARIPSDAGCSSPASISTTPLGVILQTTKGIAVVTRERQVAAIGDDVEGYEGQRIVRATALPGRNHVLLLTDAGRSLLWDYEHKQWSTFTNHEGIDAALVGGEYLYLRTDGRVFRETPGAYADGTTQIPMVIETAWIKMTGYLQGWQKVIHAKLLGEYLSPHTLLFSYRLNYAPAYSAPVEILVDEDYDTADYGEGGYGDGPYGGPADMASVYQQQMHINRRCEAISFRIEDVQAADAYGASFEISELLLTGGVLRESFAPGSRRSQ